MDEPGGPCLADVTRILVLWNCQVVDSDSDTGPAFTQHCKSDPWTLVALN